MSLALLPATAATLRPTGNATLFLPDVVSTAYSEVRLASSPDGKILLWGSTDRPGGPGQWDIWMVRRDGAGWSAPVPVAFDTASNEFDPAFDREGHYVYFFSNRPGGFGGDDIYRATFDAKQGRFGKVENLGPAINGKGDEWAPSPSADGRRLLFATDSFHGAGRHDLFVSELRDGRWQAAAPLPGPVDTVDDEFDATFVDGGIVFARSTDVENDPIALWFAPRDAKGIYGEPVRLDDRINVAKGFALGPAVDPERPHVLLFSGQRVEANKGKSDIYAIPVRLQP
jgi:hypothetical protein